MPGIDDGSKNTQMSIDMLSLSYEQGVRDIVATPHFYIQNDNADRFVERRKKAYEKVTEAVKGREDIPKIHLGAEVFFFNGISHYDGIDKLTINNTKYLLLEMPFTKWNERIISEVEKLSDDGFKVIIAHIERFIDYQKGTSYLNDLLSLDVTVQMNAEYLESLFTRGKAIKLIERGIVQILGSDCHNMTKRPPNLNKGYAYIEKKIGKNYVDKMNKLGYNIIS